MAVRDELLHLVQGNRVAEVQQRAGRIDPEFDRQAALRRNALLEFGGGLDVIAAAR